MEKSNLKSRHDFRSHHRLSDQVAGLAKPAPLLAFGHASATCPGNAISRGADDARPASPRILPSDPAGVK